MGFLSRRKLFMGGSLFVTLTGANCSGSSSSETDTNTTTTQKVIWAEDLFKISLAQWSLHRSLFGDNGRAPTLDALDFPVFARQKFDIEAVEYVNAFYRDNARNDAYLADLKSRADGEGVKSLLIMCDGDGKLGDQNPTYRKESVEKHKVWVYMAAFLGCEYIRVNGYSDGNYAEQQKNTADGLNQLAEFSSQFGIGVLVEPHGGYSSNPVWLAETLKLADNPLVGSLPDFGNFDLNSSSIDNVYDAVKEVMPYANGISAKTFNFDDDGNEPGIDYNRIMKIVLDAGFRGHVGIEYEGHNLSEEEGIIKTKRLLERVRNDLVPQYR